MLSKRSQSSIWWSLMFEKLMGISLNHERQVRGLIKVGLLRKSMTCCATVTKNKGVEWRIAKGTNQVRQFSFIRAPGPGPQNADTSASGLDDGGEMSMPATGFKFVKTESGVRNAVEVASAPSTEANETKVS